ncbi:MAG TPA: HAMP domain-containing sensor histidine kinase [Polyangiaceae bacterium]|nr:HAMP domain-containing sensor histidine kinase [Polyangiaceae bacterium]
MNLQQFDSVVRYVSFTAHDSEVLRGCLGVVRPHIVPIVDDFYDAIEAHPAASQVITGGKPQIQRLKNTLIAWLETVLRGPHDFAYVESHARIGRVHVRIGLPQEFMFTAMNRIRLHVKAALDKALEADRAQEARDAVDKILDIELAIMLDTYREDWNEKIRSAERLATIGQLAASIGHELRNPLSTIESSLFLMAQRFKRLSVEDPQLVKHHDKIQKQVKHCAKTITNLLDLARERPPRRRRVETRTLLAQAAETVTLPPSTVLELNIPEGASLYGDPDDLLHVFANLFSNAADSGPGPIHIRVTAAEHPAGTELRVQDNGPGVPTELRQKIFDALFTTKSHGTGLGLALCRRVLYAHGGELTLEPSEHGACFRVWLPEPEEAGERPQSGN